MLNKVVIATINRALSYERSGASAPGIVKNKEDKSNVREQKQLWLWICWKQRKGF